ncbi:hypothetical protein ACHAWC_011441 [Mediolabrus comicus]
MEEPFMEPQKRWWKEAGVDTPLIHWTGLFGKHFVMPLNADGVKQVLTSKQNAKQPLYMKNYAVVKRCIGDGLVTSNGSTWHRHRRIIQPAFDNKFIEKSLNAHVPMLVDTLIKSWKMKDGTDIDIPSHFSAITLDIIGKVAFSHDFQAMKSVERWASDINASVELQDPLIDALYKELMPNMFRMLLVSFNLHHFDDLIIPSTRKNRQLLNEAVAAVVKNAHSDHSQSKAGGEKKKCLLELLFDAEDTEHSGRSSDILAHGPSDGPITVEDIGKMSYFDAFLHEVLRLYPPVGMVVRDVARKTNLLGESIPAGTRVLVPIYLLHRHPRYWTDPEEFKPQRWLKGNENRSKHHHFAFLPFSLGQRNCIGQLFAMYEAKLILAPIIREFEMKLSPSLENVDLRLVNFITLKSIPSLKVRAKSRV